MSWLQANAAWAQGPLLHPLQLHQHRQDAETLRPSDSSLAK